MVKIPSVESLILRHGPLLTSEISKMYEDKGLSAAAARQRVSRRPKGVKSLNGLPFPKRAKYLYLEGEFGKDQFFIDLVRKIKSMSPSYAAAISGLSARGGICLKSDWDIVSGCPVRQKKHISSQEVLNRFLSVKILIETNLAGVGQCISFNEQLHTVNYSEFRAKLTIEYIVKKSVKSWCVKMGFSSLNSISISKEDSPSPQFSTFCFDLVGPSYLNSLVKFKNSELISGFYVADVVWNENMQEQHVVGFLNKIETLKIFKKLPNFQPMLISAGFTKDALMKCRSKGIITVTPDTLFGKDISNSLFELLKTLEKAAEIAIGNPDKIQQLFDVLSKVEGLEGNLRGAMFELAVGHMVRRLSTNGSIDIGEIVTDYQKKRKADIDVRKIDEESVTCYECKGKASHILVTLGEVKYWLENQVPTIKRAHDQERRFSGMKYVFEFWTTSDFESEAIEYLKERKSDISKYEIEWRNGKYINDQASRLRNNTIKNILKQHYFNSPISKALL